MNLYKHYKGAVYCHIADTVEQRDAWENVTSKYTYLSAIHTEDQFLKVAVVRYGDKYFALDQNHYAIYVDHNGIIWARPYEMFHGYLEDGTKRFTLITNG